jgi:hypothetical protein
MAEGMNDQTGATGARVFAVRLVSVILEHSTRDDITAAELQHMVEVLNDLDAAHKAMTAAWDGEPEQFLTAIARLREADGKFWRTLNGLLPMTREQLEAAIEGRPVRLT